VVDTTLGSSPSALESSSSELIIMNSGSIPGEAGSEGRQGSRVDSPEKPREFPDGRFCRWGMGTGSGGGDDS
jgi:hypothetical protein